jgi:hypothetical protein
VAARDAQTDHRGNDSEPLRRGLGTLQEQLADTGGFGCLHACRSAGRGC